MELLGGMAVLAFAVSSCADHSVGSSPHHATPSYYASGVPYVYKSKLYIDHSAQPGTWIEAETGGEYTAATKPGKKYATMVILRDGSPVATVADLVSGPKFSPDGTKLAWVTLAAHDAGTLVVRDLTRFRDLGQLPILVRPHGAEGISVGLTIQNDGTVHYELHHKSWSWKPAGKPIRSKSPDSSVQNPLGFGEVEASVRLSPDHLWGVWVSRTSNRLDVQKPADPGSRFSIALPGGTGREGLVQWESPTLALVFTLKPAKGGQQRIIACDVVARTCKDATDTYTSP